MEVGKADVDEDGVVAAQVERAGDGVFGDVQGAGGVEEVPPDFVGGGCKGTVTIHNRSTAPIYLVQVGIARIRRKRRRDLPELMDNGPRPTDPFIPYLRDGWKVPIPVPGDLTKGQFYVALFRDANGRQWIRTPSGHTVRTDEDHVSRENEGKAAGNLKAVKDE